MLNVLVLNLEKTAPVAFYSSGKMKRQAGSLKLDNITTLFRYTHLLHNCL